MVEATIRSKTKVIDFEMGKGQLSWSITDPGLFRYQRKPVIFAWYQVFNEQKGESWIECQCENLLNGHL